MADESRSAGQAGTEPVSQGADTVRTIVTQEMRMVGGLVIEDYPLGDYSADWIAERVFCAMEACDEAP